MSSGEDGALPPAQRSPLRTPDPQPCLTDVSMELEGDCDSHESVEPERSSRASHSPDRVLSNDRVAELPVQSALHSGRPAFADQQHSFDKDLQAAIDFFKLPPPLLSPVPSPPRMSSPHPGSLPSPPVPVSSVVTGGWRSQGGLKIHRGRPAGVGSRRRGGGFPGEQKPRASETGLGLKGDSGT